MLTNYDALAVAGIMGLAFLRGPQSGPADPDFAIHLDDGSVLVVGMTAPRAKPAPGRTRRASSPTVALIEKAVEKGLPRAALRHVAEWLAGDDPQKVATLEWGVVPKTTLERRNTQLSPQESERTERVARLSAQARRVLGSRAEARAFMTASHPELDGRSPLDAARTDLGTRRVEQLLNAIEYGLAL